MSRADAFMHFYLVLGCFRGRGSTRNPRFVSGLKTFSRFLSSSCYTKNSTSVNLWSLERIQKTCLHKTSLSVRSGSLNGHLQTNLFRNGYAQAARTRSKTSRRRWSWYKPHLFACPVCGVIRVDFQHPNLGDGSTSGNHVKSFFKWRVG